MRCLFRRAGPAISRSNIRKTIQIGGRLYAGKRHSTVAATICSALPALGLVSMKNVRTMISRTNRNPTILSGHAILNPFYMRNPRRLANTSGNASFADACCRAYQNPVVLRLATLRSCLDWLEVSLTLPGVVTPRIDTLPNDLFQLSFGEAV